MNNEKTKTNIVYGNFISKIIMNLDGEKKEDIALTVVAEAKLKKIYWVELSLSAIIATLGLLNNSTAVVIGAMLIAPIFRPIQTLSFGIITGSHKMSIRALKYIVVSIVLAISLSVVFSSMIPITYETSEIVARINPNILDLFIAIFSAVIAFLSIMYKKEMSTSIAGVAMAASLLPPLAVVGIEINLGNFEAAWGSFLLFFTNIVAIIFTGIWLFFFYGFRNHQENDKAIFKRNMLIIIIIIMAISIPLIFSLLKINKQIYEKEEIHSELQNMFKTDSEEEVKIYKIDFNSVSNERERVFLGLKIPEGKDFYKDSQEKIQKKISEILKRDIDLEIEILRIAKITAPKKEPEINKKIRKILLDKVKDISIIDLKLNNSGNDKYDVNIIFSILKDSNFTNKFRKEIEDTIQKELRNIRLNFIWLPLEQGNFTKVQIKDPIKEMDKIVAEKINNILLNSSNEKIDYKVSNIIWKKKNDIKLSIENIKIKNIKEIYLIIDVYVDDTFNDEFYDSILNKIKNDFGDIEVELNWRVFKYENKRITSQMNNNNKVILKSKDENI